MAHLLMVDSWVTEMGQYLPEAIVRLGHSFTFVTRNLHHYLQKPLPNGKPHPLLLATNILTTETNDVDNLITFVDRYRTLVQIDGVTTSCDYYLSSVAKLAQHLGLPTTPPEAFDTARLKHRMRQRMAEAGLPGPRFGVASSWEEARGIAAEIGYPVVLKPTDLCSSMFVSRCQSEDELKVGFDALANFPINTRKITRDPVFLIEELMLGEEVSVEAFTFNGDTRVIGVTDKRLTGAPAFIETGHMVPAPIDAATEQATRDLVVNALTAVGYTHGMSHTEVKLTANGPRIVEINVRNAGHRITELYKLVLGVDPVEMMVQLALGQEPTYDPAETGVKSAAVHYVVPPKGGQIVAVKGPERWASDPSVVQWSFDDLAGKTIRQPADNNDTAGCVVVVDREGRGARARAEQIVNNVEFIYA